MIPFDPVDIWLWGSGAAAPAATTTVDKLFVGEIQQIGLSGSMDTSVGLS